MNSFLTLVAALAVVATAGAPPESPERFVFTDASSLWVTGTSSLHDWQCDAAGISGWVSIDGGDQPTAIPSAEITVSAANLECNNGTMNRKARGALNVDDNPEIRFELTSAEVVASAGADFGVRTTGRLTIAGQTQEVSMTVNGFWIEDGQVRLTGALPVTMTNFGVDPPRAMLGTLKTGDDVVVHFDAVAAPSRDL